MERHPTRSWGVILQQAWTMFLKDRVQGMPNYKINPQGNGDHKHSGGTVNRRLCFGYNAGYCKFGAKCKFDHKCGFCSKFGHGTFNCRKVQALSNQGGHSAQTKPNDVTPPPPQHNKSGQGQIRK